MNDAVKFYVRNNDPLMPVYQVDSTMMRWKLVASRIGVVSGCEGSMDSNDDFSEPVFSEVLRGAEAGDGTRHLGVAMKTRRRPSSIDRLPKEIRERIAHLYDNGRTIDQILAALDSLLPDEEVPSRSAMGRYLVRQKEVSKRMRESRQVVDAIAKNFGDKNNSEITRVNLELMNDVILKTIAETCIANGMQVVVDQEVGANNSNAAQVSAILELRQRLREWAYKTPNVYLHDAMPVVMQPGYSSTVLQFNTNYAYDGTHYNARGAYFHGKSLANVFMNIMPPRIENSFNRVEGATDNKNAILTANPSFQGTAGTASTGVTGNVPTNFTAGCTGSATATATITTNADGTRQAEFDCTFTARGERFSLTVTALNADWNAGTILEGFGEVEVQNPVNISGAELYMSNNLNDITVELGDLLVPNTGSDAYAAGPTEGYKAQMNTKVYAIGTVTKQGWVSIALRVFASGAGTGKIIVKNLGIRKRLAV